MNHDDLQDWSKRAADWIHDYHQGLRDRPVRAQTRPGDTRAQLPGQAPEKPEPMEAIFEDFARIVPDAMTHWQHPRFFAYFPGNASPASMLAEQLANAMAAQAMLWQTSPAATEMEEAMVIWLRDALGLDPHFTGTLHDSATTATLSAILTMREQALNWLGNAQGLQGQPTLRLYASSHVHSSIDKDVRIAGIGQENLVKIPTDAEHAMDMKALDAAIRADREAGHLPAGIILCVGGTGIGACDRIADGVAVARVHGLPTHVDAAWAGSAMICPEYRHLWEGIDGADSIVFNPHKWLGVQFDCSVQFLANPDPQVRTLGLRPDYLKTLGKSESMTDFNEWTVPLGRRFRALKIWFTLRAYGLEGLRQRIHNHVAWAEELAETLATLPGIQIVTHPQLSLFSFALDSGDAATEALLKRINDDGRVYLTQTRHHGRLIIRVQVGQFDCTREDVMCVYEVVKELL
ncbi:MULTISPECIES: pyridoxal-dependent decarboxylase [unclassified Ectothiorhodospira]|uniref:pyridoxal phosphate-dependent decarboxylase family protein n=1 Tax=unclassified Ectothiorhodospira TaxID=2684909 RepID=UPI001EE8A064|nr:MULTISPECIES: pyridoxal-dependent decarboxylase [unclassified Ectothiorhodospira]MCG5515017.1 pyridoxal-dependent decarboxylase [Ectothiorhodospira sp. 9100]MCG5517660.1 pyridoxal-dependent decarboxylase [Ectothiorhodospira sp. 9905]